MKISQKGIDLIKKYETLSLKKYICPAGFPTIGWGHKLIIGENFEEITPEEADQLLEGDINIAETAVERNVTVPMAQYEFDALVSFTFNLGEQRLKDSTLLRVYNQGKRIEAAKQFTEWIFSKGIILRGLIKRRTEELILFLVGI